MSLSVIVKVVLFVLCTWRVQVLLVQPAECGRLPYLSPTPARDVTYATLTDCLLNSAEGGGGGGGGVRSEGGGVECARVESLHLRRSLLMLLLGPRSVIVSVALF